MIAQLQGKIVDAGAAHVVVLVGGIGYRVAVTKAASSALVGRTDEVTLLTHLAVREDALDLYGFLTEPDRRMFALLLTVPGIGPRGALAVLDIGDVATLAAAIAKNNLAYLTNVSGIGKKTAEKILIELREKAKPLAQGSGGNEGDTDAFEALQTLGYAPHDIRGALKEVPDDLRSPNDRIRAALKILGKH